MSETIRRVLRPLFVAATAVALLAVAAPASAHGIRSVVYADLSSGGPGVVHAQLQVEYDLLVVSAADAAKDDALFRAGTDAFDAGMPTRRSPPSRRTAMTCRRTWPGGSASPERRRAPRPLPTTSP